MQSTTYTTKTYYVNQSSERERVRKIRSRQQKTIGGRGYKYDSVGEGTTIGGRGYKYNTTQLGTPIGQGRGHNKRRRRRGYNKERVQQSAEGKQSAEGEERVQHQRREMETVHQFA